MWRKCSKGYDVETETDNVKLLILLGPTASGKTGLAVRLAENVGAEILNADSMQVYRFMDIGTAKPTEEQRRRVPHHLLDLVDPDESFSVADFRTAAEQAIADIAARGKRIIVCGGTGLYIRALTKGLVDAPGGDEGIRNELRDLAGREGGGALHSLLEKVDPATAVRLHPNDQFRIIRALEIWRITGRPVSELRGEHGFSDSRYTCLKLGLAIDRELLYESIDTRVESMMRAGFQDEVRNLLASGYPASLKPMRSLGYRHIIGYLKGEYSLEDALLLMKRDTRRYAKRQLTWFNQDREIKWIEYPENVAIIMRIAHDFFD
jgi:tRNA dimethylallyltransferase